MRWIVVTLVASGVAAVDGGWLASWVALAPSRIWHGEVWRLVTWPVVQPGPISLVLTCAAIFKLGGDLAASWGDRRLQRYIGQIVVATAIATSAVAAIAGAGHLSRLGGWAVIDALVIAWARQFPGRLLVLYGMVALQGSELVAVTVGISIVFAVYLGPLIMAPELFACGVAAAFPTGLLRR